MYVEFFPPDKQAGPHLEKSQVVDSDTGKSEDSEVRTSSGMFLSISQDDVITKIERRVAQVTMIPVGETLAQWGLLIFLK